MRNFKRFKEETIELDSPVIFAGQNNSGKTTVIQAIAAWRFALSAWLESGRKKVAVGLIRKEFAPVPLREFNQLWTDKSTGFKKNEVVTKSHGAPRPLEIEIHGVHGASPWSLTMEFKRSNKDQIYVKPKNNISEGAKETEVVHIPSFSGISTEETEYNREYQDILVGQGKPGDILRNLLQKVHEDNTDWLELCRHIKKIFNYELATPNPPGKAFILCEYRRISDGTLSPPLDINTAGSGFQQVLMLLAFLYARPASVLLIDEPDAHLHINLQSEIYRLLKDIAVKRGGQLIIVTHSEVLIEATAPQKIMSFFGKHPRRLSDAHEVIRLQKAMKRLDSLDLLKAEQSENKVLFVEGKSDFNILRAWSNVLEHPSREWFNAEGAYWHDMKGKRPGDAQEHFVALRAAFPKMKAFVLVDSDNEPNRMHGFDSNMQDIVMECWKRYEIENYLVQPAPICRLIESEKKLVGLFAPDAEKAVEKLEGIMPRDYFSDPVNDPTNYLKSTKSSDDILPQVFEAAGCRINKDDYYRIAEIMILGEIHGDVREMLDAIAKQFGIMK